MGYIVDSSVVIGNMILESVKQNNFSIPIRELRDRESFSRSYQGQSAIYP